MWFRCRNIDNRPGGSFEPNHVVAMRQCSPVDNPSTSRKISFAGRSPVAGKSEKKTQRRIESFRFLLPPPMTVKEETSNFHINNRVDTDNDTTGRNSRKNQTPNQDWNILGLVFRTPSKVHSLPQETAWKVEACLQKLPGCMV